MKQKRGLLFSTIFKRCFSSTLLTDEELYSNFLKTCTETSNIAHGKAVHAKFVKGFLPFSIFIRNHILNMYVKRDLTDGHKLFEEMADRNVVSWSAIIAGFVKQGDPVGSFRLFRLMLCDGTTRPNEFTLVSALQGCSLCGNLSPACQVYGLIVRLGYESNIFLVNAFLTALIRHGELPEAIRFFEKCSDKDIVTWNAMLAGYLQYSFVNVPSFWCRMVREGTNVKPDNYTFASILTGLAALSDLNMGLQVHSQLVKLGHDSEICVGNALVDMYIKSGRIIDGIKAFREMPERDVCSWTEMAAGCLQYGGDPSQALEVIAEMKQAGVTPNKFTLATAFNACANLSNLEEGKKVHTWRIKLGSNEIDACVDNALLDMYAKCGCLDSADRIFHKMKDRSIISWTTMIIGCAQNGEARKALEIFEEMRIEGIEPNYITFVCVLYACSQEGLIEEGKKHFNSMTEEHGIPPGEDHYVCMVNLLGRGGRIKEAEELIMCMPFKPGVSVWQSLLAACQLHGDVETGKRAAECAMDLDEKDASNYVLLSNMFAGLKNWDDVGTLRQLMQTRDVKKIPGTSWIK